MKYYINYRFKVESQLISLIMKFDSEIGDSQKTYDELMSEFNALEQEKLQLTVILVLFDTNRLILFIYSIHVY
jgi:hypothetical protein